MVLKLFLVAELMLLIFSWTPNICTRIVRHSVCLLSTLFMWECPAGVGHPIGSNFGVSGTPWLPPMEMNYLIKAWTALCLHSKTCIPFHYYVVLIIVFMILLLLCIFCKMKVTRCAIKSDGNNAALNSNNCNFMKHRERDAFSNL